MSDDFYRRMLREACAQLGFEELGARMNAPADLLNAWLDGQTAIPRAKAAEVARILDTLRARD